MLARALKHADCSVSVVCFHPFYPEWRIQPVEDATTSDWETVSRGGATIRFPRSQIIRRLILETSFWWHNRKSRHLFDETEFDAVIDILPPNAFSFVRLGARARKTPKIGIVHDLQGLLVAAPQSAFRRLVGVFVRYLEGRALHSSSHLIFLSEAMQEAAVNLYGVDPSESSICYPFSTLDTSADSSGAPILDPDFQSVVYSGALGEKQDPMALYDLMDRIASEMDGVKAYIFSAGSYFQDLKAKAAAAGSKLEFRDLVPIEDLAKLLDESDLQIIPQKLGFSDGAFPSKLPNIVESGTAVLAITDPDSELNSMVSRYPLGETLNDWDIDAALRASRRLLDKTQDEAATDAARDSELRREFHESKIVKTVFDILARHGATEV